ncbi:MAG: FAD-binding oxidoreductase [Burkholderiaceae bacterium]|nr:FAD-binding oxidoreductase [Burkholderiaceae bacterium]
MATTFDPHPGRTIRRAPDGRIEEDAVATTGLDASRLARELGEAVDGEVRFDPESRALYATDASNYRQVPLGVVVPKTREDVVKAVQVCRRHDVPLLSRGGGTSLAGETCNVAVVLDFSKYLDRVLAIDPQRRTARVEPGCILDVLRRAAGEYGLTFGPDPATHDHNTIGGMIGNDSGGMHTLMNGITVHNVRSLEILTYEGLQLTVGRTGDDDFRAILDNGGPRTAIYRRLDELRRRYGAEIRKKFPDIPRRVSGYENLNFLLAENGFDVARALVGTEGTCVTVLEATLELIPDPRHRVLAITGFPDIVHAADAVPRALRYGPIALEGMDDLLIEFMKEKHLHAEDLDALPPGKGWLVAEFGADSDDEAASRAQALVREFGNDADVHPKLIRDRAQQARIWEVRDAALGATAYLPNHPDTWPGWEDSAVHRDNLGAYLRELKALFHRYGHDPSVYGHFGDGLVHCRVAFDPRDEPGIERWRRFLDEAADLVVRYNGSLSGEHGDGQARGALLEKMYGAQVVEAFREFKAIWDPRGRMNPGKVIDPYPITSNLRVGPSWHTPTLETHFRYPDDHGSFAHATLRCVGVGECRRTDSANGQVMCPSFMVTREEKYSTRGRARLLFEMLRGNPIADGWKSDAVEDALSLCLACKGCRHDCPVNVDMATYKAEFRSHYYAGRLRPRAAWSMGLIHWWSRLASHMPALANFATQTPGVSALVKAAGGIAQQRKMPAFAARTFTQWFHARAPVNAGATPVLLWPDTFNDHFRPQTAIAATRALEAAGFRVTIPPRVLCCGRPLYDWGMLDTARRLWRRTLSALREPIEAGVPLIGLEPACTAAFRDELPNFFPEDPLARRLSRQSIDFGAFLDANQDRFDLRSLDRKALVQIHCHHHAVLDPQAEQRVLARMGVDPEIVPSGCCGMAGAFGFDARTSDVGMRAGERVLLPTVREASHDTLVLADGFSCREQIEQATGRKSLHVAELAAMALGVQENAHDIDEVGRLAGARSDASLLLVAATFALAFAVGAARSPKRP